MEAEIEENVKQYILSGGSVNSFYSNINRTTVDYIACYSFKCLEIVTNIFEMMYFDKTNENAENSIYLYVFLFQDFQYLITYANVFYLMEAMQLICKWFYMNVYFDFAI